jgi:hypothetical protein
MFVRIFLLAGLSVLVWSAVARSSQAHGSRQVITVRPYETLWSIAEHHYAGNVQAAIWRIEQMNHLKGADLRAGERLVLP